MEVKDVRAALAKAGFTLDNFGHMKKQVGSNLYRVKFQATSIRLEKQIKLAGLGYSPSKKEWMRIASNYFCHLTLSDKGFLKLVDQQTRRTFVLEPKA